MNTKNLIIGILIVVGIGTQSCKKKGCTDANASNYDSKAKKDDGSCEFNSVGAYDREKMLANITDNYIIPAYINYEVAANDLQNKITAFNSSPSIALLQEIKTKWKQACIDWQSVSFIDFGPAKDISLVTQTNIFPIDTALINENILSGTYNLQIPANFDAKGFQAIDYLLFGTGNNEQEVVNYFTNNIEAKNYLASVVNELKTNASFVLNSWNNSYASTFKNNSSDNSEGSSVSTLVNGISSHYETYIRKGKLGLPSGVFNGFSQQPMPGHVEGLFSGYSIDFAKTAMQALNKFIKGDDFTTDKAGQGLDDYIKFVEAKDANGNNLEATIESQISSIITKLNTHSTPLSEEVITKSSDVLATYQEMQKLVPLIKVDLTSALGVLVTYQDNDGD